MILWRQYGIRAWPSFVLIDPEGKVVGYASGEGVYEQFDSVIAEVIKAFDKEGKIDRRRLELTLERERAPRSALSFPGKVLADEASKRLFIADSNHNRIVILSLDDYSVTDVVGSGEIGLDDGSFEDATFNHPQGMALDGTTLHVADTDNHSIRTVNLDARTVSTPAGTGAQARSHNKGGRGRETALNSPWDLLVHGGALYIAMAGPHQIWHLDLKTNRVRPYAGSGREARIDGPLASAALAQPSGITTDGEKLYFADSEVSSIRSADLDPKGRVETIVGGDLFEFGDRDGKGLSVRLQHPLGVVYHDGVLYVADTYNNKIKRVSLADRTAETFLGTGKAGMQDGGEATFDEPAGVSLANGKLYIADTNNHLIRIADLATRRVETLEIKDAGKLWPEAEMPEVDVTELPAQTVAPGEATLRITLSKPEGYKLNADAPSFVTVTSPDASVLGITAANKGTFEMPTFPLEIPVAASEGAGSIRISYALYYCESGKESLCYFEGGELALPVKIDPEAKDSVLSVPLKISAP